VTDTQDLKNVLINHVIISIIEHRGHQKSTCPPSFIMVRNRVRVHTVVDPSPGNSTSAT